MIKVKNRQSGKIVEAIKDETGNYSVEGQVLSKEEMGAKYVPHKEEPKPEEIMPISNHTESMSDELGELAKDLCKANGQMINGKKDKEGYGYSYMTLGNLSDIVRPVLAKNNLSVIQTHNSNGKTVVTNTMLLHSSGQWIKSSLEIPLVASKQLSVPQQVGVVCTYSRRYAIQALFMIVAEDDDDGKVK